MVTDAVCSYGKVLYSPQISPSKSIYPIGQIVYDLPVFNPILR